MKSRIEKWTDRVQRDGLVGFAIGHLQESKVDLPLNKSLRSAAELTQRAQLAEMLTEVLGWKDGEFRFRLLQDAVRQKRARLVREKEKRSVKRLDLRDTVCAKLESLSRASRLHQRTLVENLITDEAAIRNSESVTLKRERQKIKEDSKRVKEKEAELKARDAELKAKEVELSRREDGMSQGLDRLAAFEKLLNTVIECEVDDLNVQINVDQGDAIKSLIVFSSASSPDSVNPLADAWNEVLDHFGEGARHS